MGKGYKIFFTIDIIFLVIFALLIFWENSRQATGLPALSSVGNFVVYLIMFLIVALALVIGLLIKIFYKK